MERRHLHGVGDLPGEKGLTGSGEEPLHVRFELAVGGPGVKKQRDVIGENAPSGGGVEGPVKGEQGGAYAVWQEENERIWR